MHAWQYSHWLGTGYLDLGEDDGQRKLCRKGCGWQNMGRPDLSGPECSLWLSFMQHLGPSFFEIARKSNDSLKVFPIPKGKLEKDLKSWPPALRNTYIFNQRWGAPNIIAIWMAMYLVLKQTIHGDSLPHPALPLITHMGSDWGFLSGNRAGLHPVGKLQQIVTCD